MPLSTHPCQGRGEAGWSLSQGTPWTGHQSDAQTGDTYGEFRAAN